MPRSDSPRRVLFIAEGGLGDHVALTPAIRSVKESFPGCTVAVFSTHRQPTDPAKIDPFNNLDASDVERANSVFSTNPHVDELYVLNRRAFNSLSPLGRIRAEWSVVRFLRHKRFDTVISTFPHKDRFVLWAYLSGASRRIGARNQGLHWLLTDTPDIEKSRLGVVEYYCALARAAGATVSSSRTEYHVNVESRDWAETQLKARGLRAGEYIAVHPGASGGYKAWPPVRFAALIDHLQHEECLPVVLLQGEMDEKIITEVNLAMQSSAYIIDCRGGIGRLAALIEKSRLCISNDSGPRHLAVAVGSPSLAFFRQHHDKEWDVYGHVPGCVTLKGAEQCPVCPPEKCFDRIPEGKEYGAHCLRMVTLNDAIRRVGAMLQSSPEAE